MLHTWRTDEDALRQLEHGLLFVKVRYVAGMLRRATMKQNICPFFMVIFNFCLLALTSLIPPVFIANFLFHLKDRFILLITGNCWCTSCGCLMCRGPYMLRSLAASVTLRQKVHEATSTSLLASLFQPAHATGWHFWKGKVQHYERVELVDNEA